MSSISSILSVARTALTVNQAAIGVVSHNIANASTPGYSRQRAELMAGTPLNKPFGSIGTGVVLRDIGRLRDSLLDIGFRNDTTHTGFSQRRSELLGQVQDLHGDLLTPGLGATLDAFWNAWSDLANDPSSSTARVVVQQTGNQLVQGFRRLAEGISTVAQGADQRLRVEVESFNRLAANVAGINERIVAAESGGTTAGDLRDMRDRAIDEMASIAGIQVIERQDGSVAVNIGGINVVDGNQAARLNVATSGGTWSLVTERGGVIVNPGGTSGATIGVLNVDLPAARAELDTLARALVGAVNTVHATGINAVGQTGLNFFEDNGDVTTVTAAGLSLSADVADHRAIAAGTAGVDPVTNNLVYAPGRNDIALALAGLRAAADPSFGGRSIGESYAAAIGRIGSDVRAAADASEVHGMLASQADVRRSSVSGVSIDEELIQLIRFQNAYAAAARVITAADEMMQTILAMKR